MDFEPLGKLYGYCVEVAGQKFININSELHEFDQRFVCAYELGHALLHTTNTPFIIQCTFLSVSKIEREANAFAVELLVSDDDIEEYKGCTIDQMAHIFGIPPDVMPLRF